MPRFLVMKKGYDSVVAEFDTLDEFESWMMGEADPENLYLFERKPQDWVIE